MGYTPPQDLAVFWWLWVSCCLLEALPPGEPPAWSTGWISLEFSVLIFKELQLEHLPLWVEVFLEKGKSLPVSPSLETQF